jgi:hypothetical protein
VRRRTKEEDEEDGHDSSDVCSLMGLKFCSTLNHGHICFHLECAFTTA